ncbi:MAG: hypothetical protein AAF408_17650, partial [Pseudomonadota bacterium]
PSVQTLSIRARDGEEWGAWENFTLTTLARPAPPELTLNDVRLDPLEWIRLSDLMTFTDVNGDALSEIELWDAEGGDNWFANGGIVDASSGFITDRLSSVWVQADVQSGTQTLWARASDGTGFGSWQNFVVETYIPPKRPETSIEDQRLAESEWVRLTDILDFTDANGDAIDSVEIYDAVGGDNWWADGGFVDASPSYTTANIASVWLQADADSGTQNLWYRASDGGLWSAWDNFDLTTL